MATQIGKNIFISSVGIFRVIALTDMTCAVEQQSSDLLGVSYWKQIGEVVGGSAATITPLVAQVLYLALIQAESSKLKTP